MIDIIQNIHNRRKPLNWSVYKTRQHFISIGIPISKSCVYDWVNSKNELVEQHNSSLKKDRRKRLPGVGRKTKLTDEEEDILYEMFINCRNKH